MTTWIPRSDACPHLGKANDPASYLGYHSPANRCHRVEPSQGIALVHQARICLTEKHRHCPVFSETWSGQFPDGLRLSRRRLRRPWRKPAWPWLIGISLAATGILLFAAWQVFAIDQASATEVGPLRPDSAPRARPTSEAAHPSQSVPTATLIPSHPAATPEATATFLPQPRPSMTPVRPPTIGPGWVTQIGPKATSPEVQDELATGVARRTGRSWASSGGLREYH